MPPERDQRPTPSGRVVGDAPRPMRSVSASTRLRKRVAGRLLAGRADRSAAMGSGHVARVAAVLAAWVAAGGRSHLWGEGLTGFWRARLEAYGVTVTDGRLGDADFMTALHQRDPAAVVIDGYHFGPARLEPLSERWPVLAMDDHAHFPHPAQVVLNQNPRFSAADYGLGSGQRCLTGTRYVLLRPEFWAPASADAEDAPRVLVTFGSSDPARLTVPIVDVLRRTLPAGIEIGVMAGPAIAPADRETLRRWSRPPRLEVHWEVSDVARLFRTATVAVTAAGTTLWELVACGVTPVAVQVADNQAVVAAGLRAHDAGLDLGRHTALCGATVAAAVTHLLENPRTLRRLKENGRDLVDGRGVWRAIDALLDAVDDGGPWSRESATHPRATPPQRR